MRSHGRREAHGTHLCRPGPWAGPGGGMALKISRVAHHMHAADVPGFCRHQNYIFFFEKTAIYRRKHPVARGPVDVERPLRWWCYCPRWSMAPMWWARSRLDGVRRVSAVSEAFLRRFYRYFDPIFPILGPTRLSKILGPPMYVPRYCPDNRYTNSFNIIL